MSEEDDTGNDVSVIFPKNKVITDLARLKESTKKRASAIAGEFGQAMQDAVENKHADRKAVSLALQLNALDDERLAITLPHLMHYIEVLGLDKRADVQPVMFETDKNGRMQDPEESDKKGRGKKGGGRKKNVAVASGDNVTTLGVAARRVAEAAGEKPH